MLLLRPVLLLLVQYACSSCASSMWLSCSGCSVKRWQGCYSTQVGAGICAPWPVLLQQALHSRVVGLLLVLLGQLQWLQLLAWYLLLLCLMRLVMGTRTAGG